MNVSLGHGVKVLICAMLALACTALTTQAIFQSTSGLARLAVPVSLSLTSTSTPQVG